MSKSPPRKSRARPQKGSRAKRWLVISIVAVGVVLEVLANVVQLVESPLVSQSVSSALSKAVPAKVHEALRAAIH